MFQKIKVGVLGIVVIFPLSGACNSYTPKNQDGIQTLGGDTAVDFETVQKEVFQPNCVACHGSASGNAGGVNLETYENVVRAIDQIQNDVLVRQSMPPGQPLPAELQQVLAQWISNGTPETTAETVPPSPSEAPVNPAPQPAGDLQPTFSSITQNILEPKCAVCHTATGTMPVTDYNFLLKSSWVVPGDPTKSALFNSVSQGQMPPGGNSLSQDEINAIGTWITNGAQNN